MNRKRWVVATAVLAGACYMVPQADAALVAHVEAYTMLESGFKAEVVATHSGFLGGVAFAPDGDILSDHCSSDGSPLGRWDVQGGTSTVNGSTIFTSFSHLGSSAGCGLTTHSNGGVYTNTSSGARRLDPATGAQVGPNSGGGGNALGISEDPLTGNLYWVSTGNTIKAVTPDLLTIVDSSFANNGGFTDGIFWNPDGSLLYTTDRSANSVDVFDRTGALTDSFALGHEPDGIAFASGGFVLTNNLDGTISRIAADGTVSLFASGGFRGDLAHVGPDGAWYITQNGTRYADGTTSGLNSIVRISAVDGGGFIPPPGTNNNDPSGVPEPLSATLGLMGLGVLGMATRRRVA